MRDDRIREAPLRGDKRLVVLLAPGDLPGDFG